MKFKAVVISSFCTLSFFFVLNGLNRPVKNVPHQQVTSLNIKQLKQKAVTEIKKNKPKMTRKADNKSLKPQIKMKWAGSGTDLGLDIAQLNATDSELFGNSEDVTLVESMVDEAPSISYREPIEFPDFAKEEQLSGFVTLSMLVQKDGRVEKVKVVESQPQGVFDNYALQSVQNWIFVPARLKGQKVSVWVKQKIDFQVN
ncbi:MAG: TonB family protein [Bdellovibrionales bacterium]|nr:TonB family protein [Bdellovibrionales bacterium]